MCFAPFIIILDEMQRPGDANAGRFEDAASLFDSSAIGGDAFCNDVNRADLIEQQIIALSRGADD